MNLLAGLETDDSIQEDKDYLGGFIPMESGLYDMTVEAAFLTESKGKAKALNVHFKNATTGKALRSQFWLTSGEAKGCKNYYETKKGTKAYLPGFTQGNHLALLTAGKELSKLQLTEKVINLYNSDAKGEVPTKVAMIMDMLDKEVTIGVIKQVVDVTKLNSDTDQYESTGKTRIENEADKFFRHKDGLTVTEIKAKTKDAVFKGKWNEKWENQTRDNTSKASGAKSGAPKKKGTSAEPETDVLFT